MRIRPAIVKALQRARLNKVAHRFYYKYVHGFRPATPEAPAAIRAGLEHAKRLGLSGDYFEFGVFKGYAFWCAQRAAIELGFQSMRFFGFDSFKGLPEVKGIDATANDAFYEGQYSCSKEDVVRQLDAKGIDWSRTFLVEGYFEDSLQPELRERHHMERAAVALIDCDLYGSTKEVLRFLAPMVAHGSVLLFDDWDCFEGHEDRGQRRAFREFLASQPEMETEELFSYGAYGKAFRILPSRGARPEPEEADRGLRE